MLSIALFFPSLIQKPVLLGYAISTALELFDLDVVLLIDRSLVTGMEKRVSKSGASGRRKVI